jgi:hypothetical protein
MADQVQDPIAALAARLADLEEQVTSLRAQLSAAREGLDLTMRGQGRCRACGGSAILHAMTVLDRTQYGTPAPMAVALKGTWVPKPVGTFEIYLCVGCGFTEWYVRDPDSLDVDGEKIKTLDSEDPGKSGPYR